MIHLFCKLFISNSWTFAWREIDGESGQTLPIGEGKVQYHLYREKESCFYADSFVVEDAKEVYVFVESLNRYHGKGTISVTRLEGGRFGPFREVLNEPFHLSFPNVFRYGEDYFMIPETADAKQIRLYRATEFPEGWELDSILLDDGKRYVDSSLQVADDTYVLNCHLDYLDASGVPMAPPDGSSPLRRFVLDMEHRKLKEMDNEGYHDDRPAGNCFTIQGNTYRPTQNCADAYGQGVFLYQICDGSEQFCGEMKPENLVFDRKLPALTGTHTLNRSEHYEVIDVKYDRLCFSKPWMRAVRMLRTLRGDRR